jgi:pyruvate/2-oxoglutarate dehydrogenase complex dihydrolipoamide acyltransferase (E2) component
MTITFACDHRILYGAQAARALGEIADSLRSARA